jgi:hypothetical protein
LRLFKTFNNFAWGEFDLSTIFVVPTIIVHAWSIGAVFIII